MDYRLYTLVDITESGVHRGSDKKAVGQQANYNTMVQVIGLQSNVTPKLVKKHTKDIKGLGFGSQFKGEHNYWEFIFEIEYGLLDAETLKSNFDLVPVILGLEETVEMDLATFNAQKSKKTNIVFDIDDK